MQPHQQIGAVGLGGLHRPAMLQIGDRQADQGPGMGLRAAGIGRQVEQPGDPPGRIEDRHRGADQEAVLVQIMLRPVDLHQAAFGQRRADRIGAFMFFRPAGARLQEHPAGPAGEAVIAAGIQDQAAGIGQDRHAARIRHGMGEQVEFGGGKAQQVVIALPLAAQRRQAERILSRRPVHRQPARGAALPGPADHLGHGSVRQVAGIAELAADAGERLHLQPGLLGHPVVLPAAPLDVHRPSVMAVAAVTPVPVAAAGACLAATLSLQNAPAVTVVQGMQGFAHQDGGPGTQRHCGLLRQLSHNCRVLRQAGDGIVSGLPDPDTPRGSGRAVPPGTRYADRVAPPARSSLFPDHPQRDPPPAASA